VLLATLLLCCAGATANAQGVLPSIENVSVGFGGKYKVGYWTRVQLKIQAGSEPFQGQVSLEIPDAEGGPCRWTGEKPFSLAAHEVVTISRYVKFGRLENRLSVLFEPEGKPVERVRLDQRIAAPAPTTARYAIHMGPVLDWELAMHQRRTSGRESCDVFAITEVADLPDSDLGYDALDFISVTTTDLDLLSRCSATQRSALIEWVRTGGRVLISSGKNGKQILGEGGVFAPLSLGKFAGVATQTTTKGLEGFVNADVRLDSVGGARDRNFGLPISLVTDYRGRVVLDEPGDNGESRPIILSAPSGFGHLVFVSVDLSDFPFSAAGDRPGWDGTPQLLAKLVDELMGQTTKSSVDGRSGGNLGYSDLAGQFQTAMDHFPGVSLVPFSVLVALIIGYALLVTVGDYFFLRRLVKRMHWTWLSFPLVAMLFCAVAVSFVRSSRSSVTKARQVELVDIDVEGEFVRGRVWLHIYSPSTQAFRVSFSRKHWNGLNDVQSAISWHGMPGKGVGGMDRRALSSVFDEPYGQTPPGAESTISGLPIQFASSRRLLDEWIGNVKLSASSELKTTDGVYLRGAFSNPLDQELDGVMLIYRNSAYRFSAQIAPGQRQFIDPSDAPVNLNWLVTQRRTVETKDVSTPWDPTSEDLGRMMEMFTLHEAAGAESYTGLANRFYRKLDLTEHAAKGQAILYGRVKRPISEPKIQIGAAQNEVKEGIESWTYVRILLPVVKERAAR
jgi:hypothetical protein